MTATESTNGPVERFLARVRADLAWLDDDGFAEIGCSVLRSRFDVSWKGPRSRLAVAVDIPRREIVVRVCPDGAHRWYGMAQLLGARGLRAGGELVAFSTWEEAEKVIDRYMDDLRLMRGHELAGKWSEPDVEAAHREPPREAAVDAVLRRAERRQQDP